MRCPACGARYENAALRCPECGALQNESARFMSAPIQSTQTDTMKETAPPKPIQTMRPAVQKAPSLIEFPGANRNALPEWRKELGERVREVQEKRAREAAAEAAEAGPLFRELEPKSAPTLELLPQAEIPPMNPLVVAALRRIERAHSQLGNNAATATALAYEEQPTLELDPIRANPTLEHFVSKPERVHNLAVVPTPEVTAPVVTQETKKPRRIIGEQNDPALNYLDSIATSVRLESHEYDFAPVFRRLLSGLTDLLVVALLSSPILALTELTKLEWQNPRVISFAAGTFLVVSFVYLTISVAFTGRTIGMKLLSLRVVDARTGLIPTGGQSAGRSLVYLLSLASAGIALMYTFIDREKQTVHDRVTRTAVIRA